LECIVEFALGHPLTIQMVGSSAWNNADRQTPEENALLIRASHATDAIEAARAQLAIAFHRPMWAHCDEAERQLLATLAKSSNGSQATSDLLKRLKGVGAEPQDVLDLLVGRGVLCRSEEAVSFVIPGLGDFVRARQA
jgi:hypothetical protein